MKTRNRLREKQGFTLIELLVVILLMGILVGMLFVAGQAVVRKAQARTTYMLAKKIESACNQYYMEYNTWPNNSTGIVDTNFVWMLQGHNTLSPTNWRNIVFMEVDSSIALTNGTLTVPINPGTNPPVNFFQLRFATGSHSYDWLAVTAVVNSVIFSQRVGVIVWAENPYYPSNSVNHWIGSWQ